MGMTRQGFEKQVVGWCGARIDGGRNNERGGGVGDSNRGGGFGRGQYNHKHVL